MYASREVGFLEPKGGKLMKRSKHTIVYQILGICDGGASKTNIVYEANLNSKLVNPYIELLTKNGLIKSISGRIVLYKTTNKGLKLLENFKQIDKGLSLT
jgi:predicted transcriptional regulator